MILSGTIAFEAEVEVTLTEAEAKQWKNGSAHWKREWLSEQIHSGRIAVDLFLTKQALQPYESLKEVSSR